jgi:hypothetical protein
MTTATRASGRWLSPTFRSLGMNTTLKSLSACIFDKFGDELCTSIRNGLAKNSTLEDLALHNMYPSDDDGAGSARNALSFLRTNTTLKSLTVSFVHAQNEWFASNFRLEAVTSMKDSPFVESLTIETGYDINFEELLELISVLQRDTTLKTLGYQHYSFGVYYFSDDEVNQLVPILMKNYELEHLVPSIRCVDDGIVDWTGRDAGI